jgi:hypothetical protein
MDEICECIDLDKYEVEGHYTAPLGFDKLT